MSEQQRTSVASTTLISVFVLGLVLGLFIGGFGGPLIERYFNKSPATVFPNKQGDPNAPRDEGGGRIITPAPAPSESKPMDAKPADAKPEVKPVGA